MTKQWLVTLGALCALGSITAPAQAVNFFTDTFDADTLGFTKTSLVNWTVTRANVDVIGPTFYDLVPGNGRYTDLAGTVGKARIEATFAVPAGNYNFSIGFELGANGGGARQMDVSALGFSTTVTDSVGQGVFINKLFNFAGTSTGTVTLVFDYLNIVANSERQGYLLNDVTFDGEPISTGCGGAAPEPATVALAVLGLGAGIIARRRRG